MSFKPDMRNLGGRKAIVEGMTNHYAALLNIKPVIKIEPSESIRKLKPKKAEDLGQVAHTFGKVESAKSEIDSKKPGTLSKAQQLLEYKNRKNQTKKNEHVNNIMHMQRRINSLTSKTEKKKNEWDSSLNPPYFFRQVGEKVNSSASIQRAPIVTSIEKYLTEALKPKAKTQSKLENSSKQQSIVVDKQSNTSKSKEKSSSSSSSRAEISGAFESEDPPKSLVIKLDILETILTEKIAAKPQIEELFQNAREKYQEFPEAVEEAISFLRAEL